ncbi:MAG: hypothetical protein UY09_C0012G0037 [Parcubacteria group bacterium GW2011_GWA2_47_8]|nr:MAG: hypothetical protein UY09_C0012G0037 [Parcubacteria group bacterium GW2011_GWA2_47_8]
MVIGTIPIHTTDLRDSYMRPRTVLTGGCSIVAISIVAQDPLTCRQARSLR